MLYLIVCAEVGCLIWLKTIYRVDLIMRGLLVTKIIDLMLIRDLTLLVMIKLGSRRGCIVVTQALYLKLICYLTLLVVIYVWSWLL